MTRLAVLTSEGVLAAGFEAVLSRAGFDVRLFSCLADPVEADLLLIDVASLASLETAIDVVRRQEAKAVLWCDRFPFHHTTEAIEHGVRGILPVTSSPATLVEALRGIEAGEVVIRTTSIPVRPPRLGRRGRELLGLVCRGLKNKEIAALMGTTEESVKTSLHRLYRRAGVHDRLELALSGLSAGSLRPEVLNSRKGKPHESNRHHRLVV